MFHDPLSYFFRTDLREIKRAKTFEEMRDIALRVIARIPTPVTMVCGPITNGGFGRVEKNLERFHLVIALLAHRGEHVFTQMPFEMPIQRIKEDKAYYQGGDHLLETFYGVLMRSGHITRLAFIPGWEGSYGARFEHTEATILKLDARYIRSDFERAPPHESLYYPPYTPAA